MAVRENEKIAKANREWAYLKGDEAVKRMAFLREKWERDWNSGMYNAEERGIKKGREEGIQRGIKIGEEDGKIKEKREIAIKMLQKEIDEETIKEVTNLTLEEIEKLKKKLND